MDFLHTWSRRAATTTRWLARRVRRSEMARRTRRAPQYYVKGLYQQLMHKDIFLWAQAIAFKVLITIVPVLILATGVLGQVLQREKPFETIAQFVRNFLPPERSEDLLNIMRQLSSAGDFYTIVGVVGLFVSAVTLFTTLRVAVGNVFQEEWHANRSILGGYLFDIRMVVQVGLFFILTFGLSLAVSTLKSAEFGFIERVGLDYVWVREGWRRAIQWLGLIIPFFLTTAMFYQLLFFVPKPHPPKRSAFVGALFTSVLWEISKFGFTIYAAKIGRFDRYSSGESVLGQTFGMIILFVFWVYFSGVLLLLGAMVSVLHEKGYRSRRKAALAEVGAEIVLEEPPAQAGVEAVLLPLPAEAEPSPLPATNGAAEVPQEEAEEDWSLRS